MLGIGIGVCKIEILYKNQLFATARCFPFKKEEFPDLHDIILKQLNLKEIHQNVFMRMLHITYNNKIEEDLDFNNFQIIASMDIKCQENLLGLSDCPTYAPNAYKKGEVILYSNNISFTKESQEDLTQKNDQNVIFGDVIFEKILIRWDENFKVESKPNMNDNVKTVFELLDVGPNEPFLAEFIYGTSTVKYKITPELKILKYNSYSENWEIEESFSIASLLTGVVGIIKLEDKE